MKPGALSSPLEAQLLVKLLALVQVELWKAETTVVCPWTVFPPPQAPAQGAHSPASGPLFTLGAQLRHP